MLIAVQIWVTMIVSSVVGFLVVYGYNSKHMTSGNHWRDKLESFFGYSFFVMLFITAVVGALVLVWGMV